MIFQWLVSCALLAAFLLTWRRVQQGVLRPFEGVIWSVVWFGAAALLWLPETTTVFAEFFGIGRGADLVLYSAVLFLAFGFFSLALGIDRLERRLTKLVEEQALEQFRRER